MSEYEQLLNRAKWGKLSHTELFEVADELRKSDPAADRFTLLNILGNAFALEYQPLVQQYLGSEDDPMLARLALEILCGYWGKTAQYLEEVLTFMQGVSWDDEEDVRGIAISVAGEYLRSNREGRFLQELLRIFEDEEEEHINREDAYFALARAMGREWVDLPSASRHFDLVTEIDPTVIQRAKERLSEDEGQAARLPTWTGHRVLAGREVPRFTSGGRVDTFSALERISFADGEIVEINLSIDGMVVLFEDWREKRFELVFPERHWVLARGAVDQDLDRVEVTADDPVLDEVVRTLKDEQLAEAEWKALRRVNFIGSSSEPDPVLSVIAGSVEVVELTDKGS